MRAAIPYACESGGGAEIKKVYVDSARWVAVWPSVYEPAEDTWITLECGREAARAVRSVRLLVDVGSGTGVLGLTLALDASPAYAVLLDINPCAALNSLDNARQWRLDALIDVAQCDNVSCLKLRGRCIVVYNTPYLPVVDHDLEGLAWSGGARELLRTAEAVAESGPGCCIAVTFSSLAAHVDAVLTRLKSRGFRIICRRLKHVFFEDIVSVAACRP